MDGTRACLTTLTAIAVAFAVPSSSRAAEGDLDTSFNSTGTELTPITASRPDQADAVAVDSKGRIVAAGVTNTGGQHLFAVARYLPDGSLDPSFNSTGIVTQAVGAGGDDEATSVAIDSQGRIVVGGYSKSSTVYDFAAVRFTSNGHLDTSFNSPFGERMTQIGSADAHATGLAVDSQDRVVLAGESVNGAHDVVTLVRYDASGALDSSFGTGGTVAIPLGSVDTAANGVAIDSQGRIVIAGRAKSTTSNDQFMVARYLPSGALDPSFGGGNGYAITPISPNDNEAFAVAVDPQGRIIAAGGDTPTNQDVFAAVRYLSDGSLDPSFGSGGAAETPIGSDNADARAVAIDAQGRPVLAGLATVNSIVGFALARYRTDGTIDSAFGSGGVVTTPVGSGSPIEGGARGVAIDPDARIVAVGDGSNGSDFDFAVARYIGDQTPPQVTITSGPAEGSFTNNPTPSFGFTGDDPTATAACAFDGAPATNCSSPVMPGAPLGDGAHTVSITETDAAGNTSMPVARSFTVDTVKPTFTIGSGPANGGFTNNPRPSFTFTANDPTTSATCSFDSAGGSSCSSPASSNGPLADGLHRFTLGGADAAGNGANPITRHFTVDTKAPELTVTGRRRIRSRHRAHLRFKLNTKEPAALTCKLDRKKPKPCRHRYRTPKLRFGKHKLRVRAADRAGNVTVKTKRFKIVRKRR